MSSRRLFRIGSRWFSATGPKHFGGDALEYLTRYLPFGIHRVEVNGLSDDEAAWELYQHLHRQRLEWKFLAVGIIEEGREPSAEYTAELTEYLTALREPDAIKERNMAMANSLKALAMDRKGTTFLEIMRRHDQPGG